MKHLKKAMAALAALALPMVGSAEAKSWTGCYLGVQAGASYATSGVGVGGVDLVDGLSATGWQGGPIVGCDYQLSQQMVVGAFADYDFGATTSEGSIFNMPIDYEFTNQWTVGGRFGILLSPGTMLYALAGYTQASVSEVDFLNLPIGVEALTGLTVGGGLETGVTDNVTLKLEYRYTDFSNSDVDIMGQPIAALDSDAHAVRIGLNYRFGGREVVEPYRPLK